MKLVNSHRDWPPYLVKLPYLVMISLKFQEVLVFNPHLGWGTLPSLSTAFISLLIQYLHINVSSGRYFESRPSTFLSCQIAFPRQKNPFSHSQQRNPKSRERGLRILQLMENGNNSFMLLHSASSFSLINSVPFPI